MTILCCRPTISPGGGGGSDGSGGGSDGSDGGSDGGWGVVVSHLTCICENK